MGAGRAVVVCLDGVTGQGAFATLAAMHTCVSLRAMALAALTISLVGCGEVWNDPYPTAERGQNILYSAFIDRPKHLDPAIAYSEDQYTFLAQIYEPPLQYHYLKRPYTLIPATAERVPVAQYFDAAGKSLPANSDAGKVARSVYEIRIRPGIRFQPHPAFPRAADFQ